MGSGQASPLKWVLQISPRSNVQRQAGCDVYCKHMVDVPLSKGHLTEYLSLYILFWSSESEQIENIYSDLSPN